MQVYFLIIIGFIPLSLFNGYLLLGYSTVYTMFPVFALIMDNDISRENALKYSILYQTLQKGREMSIKTFMIWVLISVYQALSIVLLNYWFF